MAATILTWVEKYWPHSRVLEMLEEFGKARHVDQIWVVRAHNQVKKDARVFLLKQGAGAKGIFGAGILLDNPSEREDTTRPDVDRWRAVARFDKLCDPKDEFFISLQQLIDSGVMTESEFGPRSSGQGLLSARAEEWLVERMAKAVAYKIPRKIEGDQARKPAPRSAGKTLRGYEISAAEMAMQAFETAASSYGQKAERTMKNKDVIFNDKFEMERYLLRLLEMQDGLCAISRIKLQHRGEHTDPALLCSLDRINSDGHYERRNLQVVCRFINRWKNNQTDDEFRRLLSIVRDIPDLPDS